jgi:hypothetical protein
MGASFRTSTRGCASSAAPYILEWIEDERRWAESFARTQEALVELAREALAEHDADQDTGFADSDLPSLPSSGETVILLELLSKRAERESRC